MWNLLLALSPAALAVELPSPLSPEVYLGAVLAESPALSAVEAEIDGATAAAAAARRPANDPMVSARLEQLRLDQFPGWAIDASWEVDPAREARVAVAVAELELSRAARQEQREQLEIEAMEAWAAWAAATAALRAIDEQLAITVALERVAEASLVSGRGDLGALQRAQLASASLASRRVEREAALVAATAAVNNLLHRQPEAALPPPTLGLLPSYLNQPGMHPEMRLAEAERAVARAETNRAAAESLPRPTEWMAGVAMERLPEPMYMGMAGVRFTVPVASRSRDEVAEAEARQVAADARLAAMGQMMRAEGYEDELRLTSAAAIERTLREVAIPQAVLRVQTLQGSLGAGMDELAMLLDASAELSELRAEHAESAAILWPLAMRHRQSRGAPAIPE